MASLLLAYGHSADQDGRWMRFTQQLGRWGQPKLTVDNRPHTVFADVQGSNAQFEFSGYLEGLDALVAKHGPQSRILVFNDSLFSHHSARRWAEFLKNYEPRRGPGVYGDSRLEPVQVDGRPLRHLASWMFLLEGSAGQDAFRRPCSTPSRTLTKRQRGLGTTSFWPTTTRLRAAGAATPRPCAPKTSSAKCAARGRNTGSLCTCSSST